MNYVLKLRIFDKTNFSCNVQELVCDMVNGKVGEKEVKAEMKLKYLPVALLRRELDMV